MNALIIAATLAAFIPDADGSAAQAAAEREKAYWATVLEYAHGDRSAALANIGKWTGEELGTVLDSISAQAKAARKCTTCEARSSFDALPLPMAALMHSQRDRTERMVNLALTDDEPGCLPGAHGVLSERLLALALDQPAGKAFAAEFAVGLARHYQTVYCLLYAVYWTEIGLKSNSSHARLLMARGMAEETLGTTGPIADRKTQLRRALESLEKSVGIDSKLGEARVHLGRVQWRLGRLDDAKDSLARAVGEAPGSLGYLARLFLGQVLEDLNQLEGAISEYTIAVALEPNTQIGAVALAHALARHGQTDRARDVLEQVLSSVRRRPVSDPYGAYLIGSPGSVEILFEHLRARQPGLGPREWAR